MVELETFIMIAVRMPLTSNPPPPVKYKIAKSAEKDLS